MDNGWLLLVLAQCTYAERLREAEEARKGALRPVLRPSPARIGALVAVAMGVIIVVWQLA